MLRLIVFGRPVFQMHAGAVGPHGGILGPQAAGMLGFPAPPAPHSLLKAAAQAASDLHREPPDHKQPPDQDRMVSPLIFPSLLTCICGRPRLNAPTRSLSPPEFYKYRVLVKIALPKFIRLPSVVKIGSVKG